MKRTFLLLSLALSNLSSYAQKAVYKVDDLHPYPMDMMPVARGVFQNKLVISAINVGPGGSNVNGNEIWTLDANGTWAMHEMNAGPTHSYCGNAYQRQLAQHGNKIYFCGTSTTLGNELHSWTGSGAPSLVHNITPANGSTTIEHITSFNNMLYFSTFTVAEGHELAVYDPVADTFAVKSHWPGTGDGYADYITEFNGRLFFKGRIPGSSSNHELFAYEPTADTFYVYDIYPGTSGSSPDGFTVVNGKLYFAATDANFGRELHSIDSFDNISRLTDIKSGMDNSLFLELSDFASIAALNNQLYFASRGATGTGQWLYKYDIATATPSPVASINNITSPGYAFKMVVFDTTVYFVAQDSSSDMELWQYDLVNAPSMVADLDPTGGSSPVGFQVFNNGLYFTAYDTSAWGSTFYVITDTAQTNSVKNIAQREARVYPNPVSEVLHIDLGTKPAGSCEVKLVNMMGVTVQQVSFVHDGHANRQISVRMNDLTPGMYLYRVTASNGMPVASGRVLKQ